MARHIFVVLAVVVTLLAAGRATAFTTARPLSTTTTTTTSTASSRTTTSTAGTGGSSSWSSSSLLFIAAGGTTTLEPPVRESTDQKTGRRKQQQRADEEDAGRKSNSDDGDRDYPDLEYLIDSAESREMEDPFHILLLGSTFEKPKVTVPYCAGSLEYVLAMPRDEALEQSQFAQQQGMSCLGTWPREECLTLGRQLQNRDLECRVVPFVEGGQRGWQAKDASEANKSSSSSSVAGAS